MSGWIDVLLHGDSAAGLPATETILLVMLLSFCLGHLAAWVYMKTHTGLSYSRLFSTSLVAIPVIVSLLMLLMSGNIFIAFGLLAVFAVVRFRNVLKDTRDTAFILWVMVLGMAVGTQRFSTAVVGCLFIGAVFVYLHFVGFGSQHRYDAMLSLVWTGGDKPAADLLPILRRHTARAELASQRPTGDAGLSLSYRLLMRDPSRIGELLTDLTSTECVADASLHLRQDEVEL